MDTTTKYVQGKTLRAVIDEKESLRDRLALLPYFVDICQSVGAAHGRGIVHRNLNPGNILIGEYDEAVVIDWSLSKTRGRQDDLATSEGLVVSNLITLYRALGGGWDPEKAPAAP